MGVATLGHDSADGALHRYRTDAARVHHLGDISVRVKLPTVPEHVEGTGPTS